MDLGWMLSDTAFEWIEHHLPFGSTILELRGDQIASEEVAECVIKTYYESVNSGE